MKLKTVAIALIAAFALSATAQNKIESLDRERTHSMLRIIADDVHKNYYDPKLHGVDFDGRVRDAQQRIQNAKTLGEAMTMVAWALEVLDDSHTYFIPPMRTSRPDYGWRMQMVGDRCLVTQVRPKSDAEAKGLKPGDEILSVNNLVPARGRLHTLQYLYNVLRPQPGLQLRVKSPDGKERDLTIAATIRPMKRIIDLTFSGGGDDINEFIRNAEDADRLLRTRCADVGGSALEICKMPMFDLGDSDVRNLIGRARKHEAFILDLRDNPGGSVNTLERLLGGLFDHEIKIGNRVGRKANKPMLTKSPGEHYSGKVVVLVDNNSASASELLARVVQLEKRGTVIGDGSAGAVMEAKGYPYHIGDESRVLFAALITDADVIMSDGKSLEKAGVTPDKVILPTPADLAAGRDPVLAQAAESLGVKMSPEQAGELFPYEWPAR